MEFTISQNTTLIEALALGAPDSSRTTLRSWLKLGRVLVDGKTVKIGTTPISAGQKITVAAKEERVERGLKILYEDAHLVVVDKPTGLLSVSTAFEESQTAHAILKRRHRPKRVYVVHRLDQDTSGVMVFALSLEALEGLKKTFELHTIERCYCAIVEGHLQEKKGTWRSYLFEDGNYVVRETADTVKGELAITHYSVEKETKSYSKLRIELETGKKNQIRVHCQRAGTPVVGDKKYGAKTDPLKRLGLHAHLLGFTHPITAKKMIFESPLPKAFSGLVS